MFKYKKIKYQPHIKFAVQRGMHVTEGSHNPCSKDLKWAIKMLSSPHLVASNNPTIWNAVLCLGFSIDELVSKMTVK